MEQFIALSFPNERRAVEALKLLWQLNDKLAIELDDAMMVHCNRDGNLEYDEDFPSTMDRRRLSDGLWGSLLGVFVAAVFVVSVHASPDPAVVCACVLAGGLMGVIAGLFHDAKTAAPWKDHHGISKSFVPEIAGGIGPGDSVLIALVNSVDLEMATSAFRGFGGRVLCATLPPEAIATFESVLR